MEKSTVVSAPGSSRGEFQAPPSAVLVWDGLPGASQFTQVTFVPGRMWTSAGVNVKLRMTTMVEPKALDGS
ncbi:MAG TPA: hypothetical protein VJS69_10040 [Candidatus Krumholzibacteria bacterium]|nr:hypothetical protein [Candidatus Krumholzibacteria bacterium]